jgi:hypothetical protein
MNLRHRPAIACGSIVLLLLTNISPGAGTATIRADATRPGRESARCSGEFSSRTSTIPPLEANMPDAGSLLKAARHSGSFTVLSRPGRHKAQARQVAL